ncbi:hypothetical protein ANCDUO_17586, partial [Ancylostoma duodenale]
MGYRLQRLITSLLREDKSKPPLCIFCLDDGADVEESCGKLQWSPDWPLFFAAHELCTLMVPEVLTVENPSLLGKQLFDTDIKQLNEAYARGRQLTCNICREKGALNDDYDLCCLCMDRVDRQMKMHSVVQIACCGLRFYHYDCMKNATLVRGQEMRCPTCNRPNEETFFEEAIKRQGIYFQTYNPSCEPEEESSGGNSRSRCYYAMTRTSAKERKCLSSLGPDKYDDTDALNDQVFNPLEALNGCI